MEISIKKEEKFKVAFLKVRAGVRYWEDATVDGIIDEEGNLIPCRNGDYWEPLIDLDTGQILNWTHGKTADIHYKVCDDGEYILQDINGIALKIKKGYVPDIMSPKAEGYGDYIIMEVNGHGMIANWKQALFGF